MSGPRQLAGSRRGGFLFLLLAPLALQAIGCGSNRDSAPLGPDGDPRTRFALETLGPTPYPADNPPRQERIALGRLLFFDPILAGERDIACATCHHPAFGFADRRQFGAGTGGSGLGPNRILSSSSVSGAPIPLMPRSSPTVLNAAMNADATGRPSAEGLMAWDGRVNSLETFASMPLTVRIEMRGDAYPGTEEEAAAASLDSVIARLRSIPEYETRFRDAFPAEALAAPATSVIDSSTYARAVAAYVRELVTRNAPYDRFVLGDDGALTNQQKRGLELFFTTARCAECHSGPMFSDFRFVVQGVPQEGGGKEVIPGDDTGREEHTRDPVDRYAFRTPTLRNVELTPPYMHDGMLLTLDDVVRFYNAGARPRHPQVSDPMLDPILVDPLGLSDEEIEALVAFLRGLTDPGTAIDPMLLSVPERVPSGLMPVFGVAGPGSGKR